MKNRFTSRLLSKSLPPLFVLGALANISYAQTTRTWDGGGIPTTNMDIAANWSADTVPAGATSDTAQWDGTATGPLSLTYTALTTGAGLAGAPGLFLSVLGTQTSPLTINEFSGTAGLRVQNLTVASGAGAVTFGGLAGTDFFTLGSGALLTHVWTNNSTNPVTFASDVRFGAGGAATHGITFTGTGNWNVNTSLIKSDQGTINVIKDGSGTMNIGTVSSLGNAAFTIMGGTIDNTSGAAMALTVAATTPTAYTFNGDFSYGTAAGTSLNDLSLGAPAVTLGAAAGTSRTITTNGGGLLTVAGVIANGTTANSLIKSGTGALRLDGTNTFSGGTTLNSGILHIANNAALGTGTFTINGGTIQPRLTSRTLANPTTINGDFTLGVPGANNQINFSGTVNLGGATRILTVVDTTLNPDSTFSGVISNGGLTKAGGGSLVLTGANTYAGPTTISGGLLQVSGIGSSIASTSGITINGTDSKLLLNTSVATPAAINLIQGTLDATGTVGAVSVGGANPTILANGNGGAGTLTTGALSFAGASTVNVFSAPGAPPITAGVLTTSGTAGAIAINITRTAPWSNGPNNLIAYSSSSANINEFTYTLSSGPALGARQSISPVGLVKNGNNIALQIDGTTIYWTGLKSNQWTTNTVATPKNWKQTSDNTTTDFLDSDDVVFGDTPATNQTVQIDDNDVVPSTTTFNNSTINYTFASTSGLYGIAGVSLLTKNGTGSVTLGTTNNYSGGTTLNAGTLNVNTTTALGVGAVTINGGTLNNTSGAAIILTNNSTQAWNGDFTFTGTNALDMGNGAVTGGGSGDRTVTISSGTLGVGELRTATGQGLIKQGAGTLLLNSSGAGAASSVINGTLNVAAGTLQINRADVPDLASAGDITTTGLAGTGTITNGANFERWVITTATGTFGGKLLNGGTGGLGFNKNGPGLLTLTAANGFSGATTVNGGTLSITGTNSLGGIVNLNGGTNNPVVLNLQNSGALGTAAVTVTSASRNSGIQLQGGITLASNVSFVTSGDGTSGATVPYAIDSLSGNNTINGNIALVAGGGGSAIQSDSGSSLTVTGNIAVGAGQTSRGIILQGDSTTGNLFSGVLSDLSVTSVANLIKAGTGTWTVSGTNTYSGATAVNAGTLIVSGNSPATTGTVTVATGATLGGNGGFGGALVVAAGGHHALAVAATPGAQVVRQVSSLDLSAVGDILDLTAAATPATGSYTLVHTTTGTITGQTAGVLDDTVVNFNGLTGTVAVVGGDLVLTVGGVTSPFSTWIAGYPSIPLADRDPGDDPDNDGNSNMVEFALGGTPNSGSDNAKIYPIVADSDFDVDTTKELLLTIAVRTGTGAFTGTTSKSAPSDDPAYSYTVQGSLDLVTFGQTVNVVPTAVPPAGVTLPAGYTWKTFSLDGSNGTPSKGFLRVIVTH